MNKEEAQILWTKKEYFSKGKRGLIYVSSNKDKKFVIKIKNPESKAENTIQKEYENNLLLNKYGVGPRIHYYDKEEDYVIRDYVDGEIFFEWIKKIKDKQKILNVFIDLLEQCKRMDDAKINKLEINHPHKDLIIQQNKPIIIDFERCKKTTNPKNITQLCQFLISTNLETELKKHEVRINKEKIIKLAETYKKETQTKKETKSFEELKKEIIKSFKQSPSSS